MTDQATEQSTEEQVQLTINDLQGLSSVIDVASRRGAFQGAELTQVGTLYDKLTKFLEYISEAQAAHQAKEEGEQSNG